jgi:oligogalacturonide transporter
MYLGGYIAQDVFNAVFTYYVVFVLMQEASMASNLLGTMAIFQFIAVIAMIPLCIRFGPAPSYRMVVVLFGLSSLSYAILYYAGLSDVYSLLLLISAVAGLGVAESTTCHGIPTPISRMWMRSSPASAGKGFLPAL